MIFFKNIVNEHSASPRMLIVHEVMGRDCGWLTAGERAKRDSLPPLYLSISLQAPTAKSEFLPTSPPLYLSTALQAPTAKRESLPACPSLR